MLKKILYYNACFYGWSKQRSFNHIFCSSSFFWKDGELSDLLTNYDLSNKEIKEQATLFHKKEMEKKIFASQENYNQAILNIKHADVLIEDKIFTEEVIVHTFDITQSSPILNIPHNIKEEWIQGVESSLFTYSSVLDDYKRLPHGYRHINQEWVKEQLNYISDIKKTLEEIKIKKSGLSRKEYEDRLKKRQKDACSLVEEILKK